MTTTRSQAHCTVPLSSQHEIVLTPAALELIARLHQQFGSALRQPVSVAEPELEEAAPTAETTWAVAAIPSALRDRRVELALSARQQRLQPLLQTPRCQLRMDWATTLGGNWDCVMQAQLDLHEALTALAAADNNLTLHIRPRSWRLDESHCEVAGAAVSAAVFDLAVFLQGNLDALRKLGGGAYFNLANIRSLAEARLWANLLADLRQALGLAQDELRCTLMVDSIQTLRQLDGILFELRDSVAAVQMDRPAYLTSLHVMANDQGLPPGSEIGYDHPLLEAAAKRVCVQGHKRGALALAAVSPILPVSDDAAANAVVLEKLSDEAAYMARTGFDGLTVTQSALVNTVLGVFDEMMPTPNQLERPLDWALGDEELLPSATVDIGEAGFRHNISVGIQFIEARLKSWGRVPLYNQMEDAGTADLYCRQLWHWVQANTAQLADGRLINPDLFEAMLREELDIIAVEVGAEAVASGCYQHAAALLQQYVLSPSGEQNLAGFIDARRH